MLEISPRMRWIGGIAVVALGPNAAGEDVPAGDGLAALCSGNRGVVLDLVGYKPVNSEFLGFLLRAFRGALAFGARFRVCCPDAGSRAILLEFKFDRLMAIHSSLAEALEDFGPAAG